MSMFDIRQGDRFLINGELYVVSLQTADGRWVFDDRANNKSNLFGDDDIENLKRQRLLEPVLEDEDRQHLLEMSFDGFPEKVKAEIERRQKYLLAYYDLAPDQRPPFSKKLRPFLVAFAQLIGDDHPPSFSSFIRWADLWRQGGDRDPRLLAPRFDSRGDRRWKIPAGVRTIILDEISKTYLSRAQNSMRRVYENVKTTIQANNNELGTDTSLWMPVPSEKTVRRVIHSLDRYDVTAAREGRAVAEHEFAEIFKTPMPKFPLALVEIDHTPVDCMVYDNATGRIGRPQLTLVVCRKTRMIVGFYVGFDGGIVSSLMAMRNAVERKEGYLKEILGEDTKAIWPCHGRPKIIFSDNGPDYRSNRWRDMACQLQATTRVGRSYKPTDKSIVERVNQTIQKSLLHTFDGTTKGSIAERGDYDPVANAKLTLRDLEREILDWIVFDYHHTPHRTLGCTPYEAWCKHTKNWRPSEPPAAEELDMIFTIEDFRTIQREGIEYESIFYWTKSLTELRRAGSEVIGDSKFKILVNPRDLSAIHVIDPRDGKAIWVPSKSNPEDVNGLTLWDHLSNKADKRERLKREPSLDDLFDHRFNRLRRTAIKPEPVPEQKPAKTGGPKKLPPEAGKTVSAYSNLGGGRSDIGPRPQKPSAVPVSTVITDDTQEDDWDLDDLNKTAASLIDPNAKKKGE
jgi:putative transposase